MEYERVVLAGCNSNNWKEHVEERAGEISRRRDKTGTAGRQQGAAHRGAGVEGRVERTRMRTRVVPIRKVEARAGKEGRRRFEHDCYGIVDVREAVTDGDRRIASINDLCVKPWSSDAAGGKHS